MTFTGQHFFLDFPQRVYRCETWSDTPPACPSCLA